MSMTQVDPGAGGGARNTRGRTPIWGPRLNGEELDISVTEVSMTLAEGSHDSTTLTCVSSTLPDTEGMLDMPLSFYFGVPPHTELFQGYITDISSEQKSQGSLSFTMTVLGATKMMFEGQPRFWSDKSVTDAARELVTRQRPRLRGAPSYLPLDGVGPDRGQRLGDGGQAGQACRLVGVLPLRRGAVVQPQPVVPREAQLPPADHQQHRSRLR